ncbi:MAG: methyltransferase domain-containing protein [Desulfobacteraceae bacterium]|nr:MAG: methyltransferase domain-containing protein [Desulfobacteraceae bacterium]
MNLVKRNCSVCNADDFTEAFYQEYKSVAAFGGDSYFQTVVVCNNCGFAYSNPTPCNEELSKYYRNFSNYENPQRDGKESEQMLAKWRRTYALVEKHFPENYHGSVLEIGCATAAGLSIFKSNGWDVMGIEPSEKAVNFAHDLYEIEVINGIFDCKLFVDKDPFDIIILSHVMEHLLSPNLILNDIRSLLGDGGLVYIEVPNLLRPFVPMGYFTIEHLNYFSPTTLSSLMKINGFSVEIELFDNSADIEPFYPVIAAVGKKSYKLGSISNDYDAVYRAIQDYKQSSGIAVKNIQSKIDLIIKNVKRGKLGIWAAGLHTSQLLSMTTLSNEPIVCVFDNDPKKHGKRINGVEIIGYVDPESTAKLVDAIVISSKASENEIYNQIEHLQKYGISVYKLYDK